MKRSLPALSAISLACLSIWFSLWFLNSILMVFILYYCLVCLGLPLASSAFRPIGGLSALPSFLGLRRPRRPDILWGIGSGVAICAFMLAAFGLAGDFFMRGNRILETVEAWGFSRRHIVLVYAVMIVFNGAVEEIFWRGFVHGLLSWMPARPLALAMASLPFGLIHVIVITRIIPSPLASSVIIFGITSGGFLWAILREWRGSLWSPLLSHVLVTMGYLGVFSKYIGS